MEQYEIFQDHGQQGRQKEEESPDPEGGVFSSQQGCPDQEHGPEKSPQKVEKLPGICAEDNKQEQKRAGKSIEIQISFLKAKKHCGQKYKNKCNNIRCILDQIQV